VQGVEEDIFKTSEAMLAQPSFPYAVIAVGSLVRDESGAFSDQEYMLVIESNECRAYFHRLAVDTFLRFNCLGGKPLGHTDLTSSAAVVSK